MKMIWIIKTLKFLNPIYDLLNCEVLGWKKHKLESRLLREISVTSDMQMTPPLRGKAKRN